MKVDLTADEAIDQIRQGRMVILVDDEDRENEGDLCMAAEKVRDEDIAFMARSGGGLICVTMTHDRIERLQLPKMAERNQSRFGTNFHVSIEAREGVTTGISAADRARTIRAAVGKDASPRDLVSPGHIFPIGAQDGGVLVRAGQTEGSVDLARAAGLEPAGVICEIMKPDGTMARRPDLEVFAREHGLGIVTIEQLIKHRLQRESQIEQITEGQATPAGLSRAFSLRVYRTRVDSTQFMVLSLGELPGNDPVLVRMHRARIPADVFGMTRTGAQSKNFLALKKIEEAGVGVFVYIIPQPTDLAEHVKALNGSGTKQSEALELREFGLGAQVLASLGLSKIRLMTDNPRRIVGLHGYGLDVTEQVPLVGE